MTLPINCARDPRVSLQLTRYHSWPRLREQSNGEHSMQVMRILLTVWPNVPRRLLVHCMMHDLGEMAGDVQFPFKQRVDGLKACMDKAEDLVISEMRSEFGLPEIDPIDEFEYFIFKMAECIEMWEWGLHEQNLGNRYAVTVTQRMSVEYSKWFEAAHRMMKHNHGVWEPIERCTRAYITKRLEWEK